MLSVCAIGSALIEKSGGEALRGDGPTSEPGILALRLPFEQRKYGRNFFRNPRL
jgi:hypothetical protein